MTRSGRATVLSRSGRTWDPSQAAAGSFERSETSLRMLITYFLRCGFCAENHRARGRHDNRRGSGTRLPASMETVRMSAAPAFRCRGAERDEDDLGRNTEPYGQDARAKPA